MKVSESRKRALIAESDRNRVRLVKDCNELIDGARAYISGASVVSGLTSIAISGFGMLFKRDHKHQPQANDSSVWGRTAIDAVSLLSSVWTAMHQRHSNKDKNSSN